MNNNKKQEERKIEKGLGNITYPDRIEPPQTTQSKPDNSSSQPKKAEEKK